MPNHRPLQFPPEAQQQAVQSMERYFREHMESPIGNVQAAGLLQFMLAEFGPLLYNQGVADAQERMQQRVAELDIDVHHEPFSYWPSKYKSSKH